MVIPPSSRRGRLIVAQKRLRRRLTGRGRLIAGQAAIVAVLIAIVWATLLQGGDSDTLSGIDASVPPGQSLDLGSFDAGDGKGKPGGGGNGGAGPGDGQGQGDGNGGAGGGSGFAASLAGGGPADLETGPAGTGTTPAGSQYSDTLSLLKDQLGLSTSQSSKRARRR
jgi:hypothetical protein